MGKRLTEKSKIANNNMSLWVCPFEDLQKSDFEFFDTNAFNAKISIHLKKPRTSGD